MGRTFAQAGLRPSSQWEGGCPISKARWKQRASGSNLGYALYARKLFYAQRFVWGGQYGEASRQMSPRPPSEELRSLESLAPLDKEENPSERSGVDRFCPDQLHSPAMRIRRGLCSVPQNYRRYPGRHVSGGTCARLAALTAPYTHTHRSVTSVHPMIELVTKGRQNGRCKHASTIPWRHSREIFPRTVTRRRVRRRASRLTPPSCEV